MTCQLGTDAKLGQSVPHVVDVDVATNQIQGLNISLLLCLPASYTLLS